MRVELSPRIETDLQEIGDYIARDNTARALSFVKELQHAIHELGTNPLSHRLRPDVGRNTRIAVHGQYLILFQIVRDMVWAERVVHGARNLKNL